MLLQQALDNTTGALLAARTPVGHWEGELSSSALSTATAIFAMHLCVRDPGYSGTEAHRADICNLIARGIDWLISTQNPDGGWGDTTLSFSNISTTTLCWSALSITSEHPGVQQARSAAERWLTHAAGSLVPTDLARAITARYGKDKTFSVPILTMCALAGRLGEEREAWRLIPQLPFELAACPYQWFQLIRLPVVSYALPALIAMGQVRHARRPSKNPLARWLRNRLHGRTSRLLEEIQPSTGGYLEATPLTSFVVMSLAGSGQAGSAVARHGVDFLIHSARADGSWPIDTDLATWCTTLSINALAAGEAPNPLSAVLQDDDRGTLRDWLLRQQYHVEHPYTRSPPGAWAWTDLPGGVPDADDTAGALIALWNLGFRDAETLRAVTSAIGWLLNLQNRDGGIPTFCRGWGHLPFDRSGSDLTAHALHAWTVWRERVSADVAQRIERATERAIHYLVTQQRTDGTWLPLWFGNQHVADESNATYGVSRTLTGCAPLARDHPRLCAALDRGSQWLISSQNGDGTWGGGHGSRGSIEETALAVVGLVAYAQFATPDYVANAQAAAERGLRALRTLTGEGTQFPCAPIGFYFAKLWYFERLYPLIFSAAAFRAGLALQQ